MSSACIRPSAINCRSVSADDRAPGSFGVDGARLHEVDRDLLWAELPAQRFRERTKRRLPTRVHAETGVGTRSATGSFGMVIMRPPW